MATLTDQLIKLGEEHPDLQDHLEPVLDRLSSDTRGHGEASNREAAIGDSYDEGPVAFDEAVEVFQNELSDRGVSVRVKNKSVDFARLDTGSGLEVDLSRDSDDRTDEPMVVISLFDPEAMTVGAEHSIRMWDVNDRRDFRRKLNNGVLTLIEKEIQEFADKTSANREYSVVKTQGGYASSVMSGYSSKKEAMRVGRERGYDYVVEGKQMWNKSIGKTESQSRANYWPVQSKGRR